MAQARKSNRARLGRGFKGQPWILYDTVAAFSFLAGDGSAAGLAIGTQIPAVSAKGELIFFSAGRTRASIGEVYTSMDAPTLSYGLEVWAMYLNIMLPAEQTLGASFAPIPPQMLKLAEVLINGAALLLDLGQEEQFVAPTHRFGAGGGLSVDGMIGGQLSRNGEAHRTHVLVLPEPIEMPRTLNLNGKLVLSPQAMALLGTVAAPGVGAPICDFSFVPCGDVTAVEVPQLPFQVQLGLVGRRVKRVQYGQIAGGGSPTAPGR